MIVLSSSVSLPSISSVTLLSRRSARSRTSRGNLLQILSMGCNRTLMIPSCNAVVIRLSRWIAPSTLTSCSDAPNCRIWLRARTSSPTRSINLSSRSTSTRMLVTSEDAWTAAGVTAAADSGSCRSCTGFPTTPASETSPVGAWAGGVAFLPNEVSLSISAVYFSSPSPPVDSMLASTRRTASTISRSPLVTSLSRNSRPIAQAAQQAFAAPGQFAQRRETKEGVRSSNRVHRAKDAGQLVGRRWILLELDQRTVELVDVFVALRQELRDQRGKLAQFTPRHRLLCLRRMDCAVPISTRCRDVRSGTARPLHGR